MEVNEIETSDYGICIFSVAQLTSFLSEEKKSRTKKVLSLFQKEHELYLRSIQTGSWLPIPQINSVTYQVRISNLGEGFSEEWEEKYCYEYFNLTVESDNSIWIGSIGLLLNWDTSKFVGNIISYSTLDGFLLHKGLRFEVKSGKYAVKIQGYQRKDKKGFPLANSGFLFSLKEVEEFEYTADPREDEKYKFNSINCYS